MATTHLIPAPIASNVTKLVLLGTRKRSRRKLDEFYDIAEACSLESTLEMFAHGARMGWTASGNQAEEYEIGWDTYASNSRHGGALEWAGAAE